MANEKKINSESKPFVWYLTIVLNGLILILGLAIIVLGILMFVHLGNFNTFGFVLITIGIFIIICSFSVIKWGYSHPIILTVMQVIQIILTLLFSTMSIYVFVDFDKFLKFIMHLVDEGEKDYQEIKKLVSSNLKLIQYISLSIVSLFVYFFIKILSIIFLNITKKKLNELQIQKKKKVLHGDPFVTESNQKGTSLNDSLI